MLSTQWSDVVASQMMCIEAESSTDGRVGLAVIESSDRDDFLLQERIAYSKMVGSSEMQACLVVCLAWRGTVSGTGGS